MKSLLPWLIKKIKQGGKLKQYQDPVDQYLRKLTNNQALIDIISQHFFQKTPASFALSYFSLYMDYQYPVHGTLDFVKQIEHEFLKNNGTILTSTKIARIDVEKKRIFDDKGPLYDYDELIWAADQNQLYQAVDVNTIASLSARKAVENRKQLLLGKRGGDSIFTLFLAVDLDQEYFSSRSSGHCFYTPSKVGQAKSFEKIDALRKATDKEQILSWMNEFLEYTTYEISIPSLRNATLAPAGKTGLIVSFLMDYDFIKNIKTLGFYDEFKNATEEKMIDVLNNSIYENILDKVIHRFSSSPLTIEKLSGNYDGAITGWAFTNPVIPSVTKTGRILKSCLTPIPSVLQAGQWTFSPSGLPISILTGKIAADAAAKRLKKGRRK
jgi:phytoene dehydrogenase-like protein